MAPGNKDTGRVIRGMGDMKLPQPPTRPTDGHKATFGTVVVLAGSGAMPGAAADAWAAEHGIAGMLASELADRVPDALKTVRARCGPET